MSNSIMDNSDEISIVGNNVLTTPTRHNERNVRSRMVHCYGLIPYDSSAYFPRNLKEVNIEYLLQDEPQQKKTVMYLQLLRIISGSNNNDQSKMSLFQSYYKKNKKDTSMSSSYYRLFLFRDVLSTDGRVLYIVEGNSMNDKLWSRYPLLRDNGVVSVGTYITILNPLPITSRFCNEIPIVETRFGCIVMKDPANMGTIDIDMSITSNVTRSFVLNNVQINVISTSVNTSTCSGLFCDRQRTMEISRGTRACGCYSMQARIGNVVLIHNIEVMIEGRPKIVMVDYSSNKFSQLYLSTPLTSSVKFNQLDGTRAFCELEDCIDDIIEYINGHGGFTVIGWYKRGEINDSSNVASENEVESSDIGYHIVYILATDKNLLNSDNVLEKMDIANFNN